MYYCKIYLYINILLNKIAWSPLNGNMPYLSLPMEAIPDTAIVLAESPSVNISVHSNDFPVPASLASSNLGIPWSFLCFDLGPNFSSWLSALNFAQDNTASTIPTFVIYNCIVMITKHVKNQAFNINVCTYRSDKFIGERTSGTKVFSL